MTKKQWYLWKYKTTLKIMNIVFILSTLGYIIYVFWEKLI